MKDINDFLLTQSITVRALKKWMHEKNDDSKENIINLIHHRFYNRYIKHLRNIDSGFLKIAISCLMIETLESFKQGKKDTKDKGVGKKMFHDFFHSEQSLFPGFKSIHSDFYYNIRCGILHQAETTNAWRILRRNALIDKENKTINATKFVSALEKSLDKYVATLKSSALNSLVWENALLKLENICENCKAKKSYARQVISHKSRNIKSV